MCIINMQVHGCAYEFSRFLCYLGLISNVLVCLSLIIRFNKVY